MIGYAATIFLSAFLLFQVQPLLGRFILPWFGGSPAVWTTCMLVFQVLLLAGYAYAHFVSERLHARGQAIVHLAILLLSLLFLPIVPAASWKPATSANPEWRIVALLLMTVGGPYLLLSTTGPLLQRWFSGSCPGRSPYRLYALSNLGSLLALGTYPFLVEPWLTLGQQAVVWSYTYLLFVAGAGVCAVRLLLTADAVDTVWQSTTEQGGAAEARPTLGRIVFWLLCAAMGSMTLLAGTNQMCQEVAVVPFLWILPLAVYLLTFIICFEYESLYRRSVWAPLLAGSVLLACVALERGATWPLWKQLGSYTLMLLVGCMCCHGELVRAKPGPRYLTLFYLMVAGGGALGGLFVALAAPALFHGYWEYHLTLVGCTLLMLVGLGSDPHSLMYNGRTLWAWVGCFIGVLCLVVYLGKHIATVEESALVASRNFYGVLRVQEDGVTVDDDGERDVSEGSRTLVHGRITHGKQFLEDYWRHQPITYYGPSSGVGLAIAEHPRRQLAEARGGTFRIGVVGLGAGTLAAQGRVGETIRFYEINPEVERIARHFFSYLRESPASIDVVLGDARTVMEAELATTGSQQFDVLAIDAFSSDAIPLHLLTRESFALYRRHLRDDGVLVLHVSSHHVKLNPVVRGLANELGWTTVVVDAAENKPTGEYRSEWLLVTANHELLNSAKILAATKPAPADEQPLIWTDDYSSLWQVLDFDE